MYSIIVEDGQTLLDIANQEYGDSAGLYYLLQDNPALLRMDADVVTGTTLSIRDIGTVSGFNDDIRTFMKNNGIKVNNGVYPAPGTGIAFWGIGEDFIIN